MLNTMNYTLLEKRDQFRSESFIPTTITQITIACLLIAAFEAC